MQLTADFAESEYCINAIVMSNYDVLITWE